jgi:hypothetical protein
VQHCPLSDFPTPVLSAYLHWYALQGIVDSDTLPLNVSREMLQQHSSLKTIKKKLVRKALDMIRRIVDEDPDEKFEEKESSKLMNSLSQIQPPILRCDIHDLESSWRGMCNQKWRILGGICLL